MFGSLKPLRSGEKKLFQLSPPPMKEKNDCALPAVSPPR